MKEYYIDSIEFNDIPIRFLDDILFKNEYRGKGVPICSNSLEGLSSSAMHNICNSKDYKKAPYLTSIQIVPLVYKKTFEEKEVYYGIAHGLYEIK